VQRKLPISLGDKAGDETEYRDNLLVNYTLISRDIKGDQGYILSHPGLTSFATGSGIDRGAQYNDRTNTHLRVSGERLISVGSDGVVSEIGIISGQGHAIMDNSFETQGILSDGKFWLYDGAQLIPYLNTNLGTPIDFIWVNGLYFFTDGETLFHTTAISELNIEPLTFATSEFSPDRTYGLLKNEQNQVIVFNRYTIEWFRDVRTSASTLGFGFARIQGKGIKAGIVGTSCKVEVGGRVYILGGRKEESPSIHFIEGGRLTTVATREINHILKTYTETDLQDAVMEARGDNLDRFMIVRLPNHTLLYNLAIALKYGDKYAWTIVKTGVTDDTPWRGRNGVYDPRIGKWIYGDSIDSRIGYLDDSTNSQYGEQMENIFYTPIAKMESYSINQMEIETIPGYSGGEVTAFMSMSYNGKTYGQEYSFLESQPYDYDLRFMGHGLGYVDKNVSFKFRVVSSGRTAFSGMAIEYD